MQQFLELRIGRQFFQRAPVLFPGVRLQLSPHFRQIERASRRNLRIRSKHAVVVFVMFLLAHTVNQRWQTEQLVNSAVVRILYSAFNFAPSSVWFSGVFQSMLKI